MRVFGVETAINRALENLEASFENLPQFEAYYQDTPQLAAALLETSERLRDNYPYFHPLYAGQMLKPPHPVACAAYEVAIRINPNNHALDGGRATSAMEKEAVAEIAAMFGWGEFLGHLTSGGTIANLEALWVAGQRQPEKKIVASEQAHYTHRRIASVLRLPFESIECDERGRMNAGELEKRLAAGDVGTVVVTLGTTATGAIDPLEEILELRERHPFRIHVDAAYGGYFRLASNLDAHASKQFALMQNADSIVVDPHKHGLQPYGCGCILFHDPEVGQYYKHDSPYTYFSSKELHLGEISLECSRAGAAAAALWTTQKVLPLEKGGEFARGLEKSRVAATNLYERLRTDARFVVGLAPELDIVVFLPRAETVGETARLSRRIFESAAKRNLHLALAELPAKFFARGFGGALAANQTVTCLRSVLMKPEHLEWVGRIWKILVEAVEDVGGEAATA